MASHEVTFTVERRMSPYSKPLMLVLLLALTLLRTMPAVNGAALTGRDSAESYGVVALQRDSTGSDDDEEGSDDAIFEDEDLEDDDNDNGNDEMPLPVIGRDDRLQLQQQQSRRRQQQPHLTSAVITVRRERNASSHPTGGSFLRSPAGRAPVLVNEYRARGNSDQVTDGTAISSNSDSGMGISREQWVERERKKNLRLFMIQRQIVEMLGIERRPNISASHPPFHRGQVDRVQQIFDHHSAAADGLQPSPLSGQQHGNSNMARRYQALLPSCQPQTSFSEPGSDDETPSSLTLQFNCEMCDSSRTRPLRIISATLKLKKKPRQTGMSACAELGGRQRQTTEDSNESVINANNSDGGRPMSSWLKISLYSVSRPSSRRGGRRGSASTASKRLIRTHRISSDFAGWIRFSVRTAIEDWMRYGLTSGQFEIVVTDVTGQQTIDASQVFEPRNCDTNPSIESLMQLPLSIADAETTAQNTESVMGDGIRSPDLESIDQSAEATDGIPNCSERQTSNGHRLGLPQNFTQPYIELVTSAEPLRPPSAGTTSSSSPLSGGRGGRSGS